MKQRLDKMMVMRGLAATRSEAANWIQLGRVHVNGRVAVKAGEFVDEASDVTMNAPERYVSNDRRSVKPWPNLKNVNLSSYLIYPA